MYIFSYKCGLDKGLIVRYSEYMELLIYSPLEDDLGVLDFSPILDIHPDADILDLILTLYEVSIKYPDKLLVLGML